MDSIKDILNSLAESKGGGVPVDEVMTNPTYLRESSHIIQEALQKGFDVLQLENGDIVTTGTKVIVTQYRWDAKKQQMRKINAKDRSEKKAAKSPASAKKTAKPEAKPKKKTAKK